MLFYKAGMMKNEDGEDLVNYVSSAGDLINNLKSDFTLAVNVKDGGLGNFFDTPQLNKLFKLKKISHNGNNVYILTEKIKPVVTTYHIIAYCVTPKFLEKIILQYPSSDITYIPMSSSELEEIRIKYPKIQKR